MWISSKKNWSHLAVFSHGQCLLGKLSAGFGVQGGDVDAHDVAVIAWREVHVGCHDGLLYVFCSPAFRV